MSAPGPFIVKVLRENGPCDYCLGARPGSCDCMTVVYREAFATLDEALMSAWDRRGEPASEYITGWPSFREFSERMIADGSATIPNGDVIEVEARAWRDLALQAGWTQDHFVGVASTTPGDLVKAEILAAWNAEHGIGIGEGR